MIFAGSSAEYSTCSLTTASLCESASHAHHIHQAKQPTEANHCRLIWFYDETDNEFYCSRSVFDRFANFAVNGRKRRWRR